MKKHRNKIIAATVVVLLLVVLFWWGGNAPDASGAPGESNLPATEAEVLPPDQNDPLASDDLLPAENEPHPTEPPAEDLPEPADNGSTVDAAIDQPQEPEGQDAVAAVQPVAPVDATPAATDVPPAAANPQVQEPTAANAAEDKGLLGLQGEAAAQDEYGTSAVPEGKPKPVEPQDVVVSDAAYTCTLTVRCDTILNNLSRLNQEKLELVPESGVIFGPTTVTFYEGESVFNVLQREMKKAKIHFEFVNTPVYNSAYIEGINNLYEYDCGELSGWTYKVNGWFPNYGSSRYQLQAEDQVEWVYTCDLGVDVGKN